ncbi:MAG TPA: peptide chain release factor N(5)-glutamine methyltransferase [Gemmatimonadaceae bacterium]|nr:peptide chain release factor N(5)-glutamine methyltransferase [Gemmatimonadaceae bacterium]
MIESSPTALANGGAVADVGSLIQLLVAALEGGNRSEPDREAAEIVAALLDVARYWPSANAECEVSGAVVAAAIRAANRRAPGAPLAYAVGRASFRHLTLEVDERVLIPRLETELLVDRFLERCDTRVRTVVDVGTGSGAIALSLAFEHAFDRVIGTDISRGALAVAQQNLELLMPGLRSPVELLHGALLAPLGNALVDAIVSNPPYIAYAESASLPQSVRDWEPTLALLSPGDGLSVTRGIIAQAPHALHSGGILALEVDMRRAGTVAELVSVQGSYTDVEVLLDLSGRERFVFARRS